MATKFEYITDLYRSTQAEMTDPAKWKAFLASACRNYRLSFDEQLLVYAQRPDATAVLEIERWNKHFGRWVNRGATGIAVFDQQYTGRSRLKYYFDISDTHAGRRPRPVPLWEMNPAWEPEVVEVLEGSFGALEQKDTLTAALLSAAKNAVDKRIEDYLEQRLYYKEGSYLEILDGESLEALYRPLVEASVGYMVLTRCGIDPAEHFSDEVFGYVGGFNTHDTLNALGVATGDISRLCLEEIARTVLTLHKQEINRTVAERPQKEYPDTTINEERSDQHERDHLQPGGGLPPAQPSAAPGAGDSPWEIRIDAAELPEGTPQNHVHEPADQRQTEPAPDGDPADRRDPDGADREGTGTASGRDGADEGRRSDEVGGPDEQLPADGGGDHPGGTDLQLNNENAEGTELSAFSHVHAKLPRSVEDQMSFVDLPEQEDSQQTFFSQPSIPQQIIDEALCIGANDRNSRQIICAWFMKDKGMEANAAFLRRHYGTNGAGFYFDGQKVSLWYEPEGMRIAYGTSAQKRYAANLTWEQAAVRIRELLDLGRYMSQTELEGVSEFARHQIAERLVSLRREFTQEAKDAGYMPLVSQAYDGHTGFPEIYRAVEEMLADPEKLGMVADELELFVSVYRYNQGLLRFRYPRMTELLEQVQDLQREPVVFRGLTDEPQRQFFISQDEVDALLRSGTADYRLAVYAYFRTHPDKANREKYLSHYHGEYSGYHSGNDNVTYTLKSLMFSHGSCVAPYAKVELKWNKAAARVGELISSNRFLSEEDRAAMPEYERKQLSKRIHAFFSNAPDVFQRPYEDMGFGEYWKEVEATGKQLTDRERVEEIYETMMLPLWNATAPDDRNYPARKAGLEAMQAYLDGTFSVFGTGMTLQPLAVQPKKEPDSMIHHFYVVEDLLAQGPLAITEYPDLESAWQVYQGLPKEKVKALGIQNNRKLPGSLDFIQCKDGVDTIIEDYKVVDGWRNEEIQSVVERIQALLAEVPEQVEPIAAPKPRQGRVVFAPIHPEIHRSQRYDFQITNPELGHGSKAEKYQANVEAIRLLKRIEAENRLAIPEEQEVLSRYVGWGGLADCFDDRNANYQELKSLLTEEEYAAARESSLTAFYTAPTVIGAMYRALEQIKAKFAEWLWQDIDRREMLCRTYNEIFNSIRPRSYDGSHIRFVGMNPEITLRTHQINAIAHIMYGGNTLLAHEVGAGKTFEIVAAAMESKRLGLCTKSLVVVPNHITEQWAAEWLQLYPSANILVATRKDFETKNRKKFCGRIATGDYDAIIIGHSQFEKIPMSRERQEIIIKRQIDQIIDGIIDAKAAKAERYTIKQLEKTKKSLETRLAKLNDQSRKDDVVTFEELGVDRIFVDESHYFKNLFLATKMRNVGGIAQTEAQKSSDLFMKCQYLDEITGGRGVVFATGTPISNSMVELYTIQRYLQYSTLREMDMLNFDDWAANFGETITAIELSPEGTGYRAKTRFAKFYNLPELMATFRQVADIQTADMLKLPVPKANFHTEVITPSLLQQDMIKSLADRAEEIRAGSVDPSIDNMLKITNDGRKLALDMRLVQPLAPDDEDGKVATCARNVFGIWVRTAADRSTQMIFCDLSTPHNDGTFNIYDDLKGKLTAMGIPAEEIAYIHDANSEAKKKELFAKVRSGQVRILLGSTQKMGAGTNCQDRLIALHDLDCPWRPSDLAQRLGRIVRQGNRNPEVEIFRYVTENTFDAYLYQLVENKQRFVSQVMTSKTPVRAADDVDETALSYSEIKALATGNPLIIEKCNLDMEVSKLNVLRASHMSQKYALEDLVHRRYPSMIAGLTERLAGMEADAALAAEHPKPQEGFVGMEIGGTMQMDKETAGKAIIDACTHVMGLDPMYLGCYRGFDVSVYYDSLKNQYRLTMKGTLTHTITLGNIAGEVESIRGEIADTQTQLERARTDMEAPFAKEEELNAKTARLKQLNILLNMDQKDNALMDDAPEEDPPEKQKSRDQVR